MALKDIPYADHHPILDSTPRPAFRISPKEIIYSIKQQFTHKELALRELGQNSQDAGAASIQVDYRYDDGWMMISFLDDGGGMDLATIENHFLRLFDSSKEDLKDKVGQWSLGRLSLLCYAPEHTEVVTRTVEGPAYRICIEKDLSGSVDQMDDSEADQVLGGPHGTLIRMAVSVSSKELFTAEVEKANQAIERELCWIAPQITVTTARLEDRDIRFDKRRINRPMVVPSRYAAAYTIEMSSGSGRVKCAIGLESEECKHLAPITLCCGGIPIERPAGLPWTGGEDFFFRGMHIILDSFAFETNIGRNVVYRTTPFIQEMLPKLFSKLILERFVNAMAALHSQPSFRAYAYEDALRKLLADVCVKSADHDFQIPDNVFDAPFIPSFVTPCPYTLSDLDQETDPVFYTHARPSILSVKHVHGDQAPPKCVSLADLPWEFKQFLERRYFGRFKEKKSSVFVVDENRADLVRISKKINQRLGNIRSLLNSFSSGNNFFEDLSPHHISISLGRFVLFDGTAETSLTTLFTDSPCRICINCNHPHVQNLIELMVESETAEADLAEHFLVREILFDPGLKHPLSQREQMLARDLQERFHPGGDFFDGTASQDIFHIIEKLVTENVLKL
ncbi:ATP-binding protein [Desulfotignum balticum]|uniref:ATP-binding protein n=1 Tax=Desulfotignum balticum TaxID=115781 RepID=UPI0003FC96F2|nr:ATP-binding protein [Desulfotignum balticum]